MKKVVTHILDFQKEKVVIEFDNMRRSMLNTITRTWPAKYSAYFIQELNRQCRVAENMLASAPA